MELEFYNLLDYILHLETLDVIRPLVGHVISRNDLGTSLTANSKQEGALLSAVKCTGRGDWYDQSETRWKFQRQHSKMSFKIYFLVIDLKVN